MAGAGGGVEGLAASCRRAAAVPGAAGLLDWFHAGAADLQERFRATDPGEQVWNLVRGPQCRLLAAVQAIEAAVHRWDAENAVGSARALNAALAADAVGQTFEVLAPMRRSVGKVPPGHGERFLFQRTDGPGTWACGSTAMLSCPVRLAVITAATFRYQAPCLT